jgi:hypothetical protein
MEPIGLKLKIAWKNNENAVNALERLSNRAGILLVATGVLIGLVISHVDPAPTLKNILYSLIVLLPPIIAYFLAFLVCFNLEIPFFSADDEEDLLKQVNQINSKLAPILMERRRYFKGALLAFTISLGMCASYLLHALWQI